MQIKLNVRQTWYHLHSTRMYRTKIATKFYNFTDFFFFFRFIICTKNYNMFPARRRKRRKTCKITIIILFLFPISNRDYFIIISCCIYTRIPSVCVNVICAKIILYFRMHTYTRYTPYTDFNTTWLVLWEQRFPNYSALHAWYCY